MSTIKIKQVKSRIGAPADQKRTLDALGLRKLNRVVEHESTPSILGMVIKAKHIHPCGFCQLCRQRPGIYHTAG